jgi:hypothetical protein
MTNAIAAFVIIIGAIWSAGWWSARLTRIRQAGAAAGQGSLEAARQIELLSSENAGLKGQIGRIEERLATVERIVTDPADRTAREIEQLR